MSCNTVIACNLQPGPEIKSLLERSRFFFVCPRALAEVSGSLSDRLCFSCVTGLEAEICQQSTEEEVKRPPARVSGEEECKVPRSHAGEAHQFTTRNTTGERFLLTLLAVWRRRMHSAARTQEVSDELSCTGLVSVQGLLSSPHFPSD